MCTTLATAAPIIGAAGSAGGALASAFGNKDKGQSAAIQGMQQRSEADRIAQMAMQREAQRRAEAGTRDSEGNTTSYNKAGNFWESELGERDATVKHAADAASVRRNTVDAPMVTQANIQAGTNDAVRQRGQNAAVNELTTFQLPTEGEGIASAQQDTITANREATRPVVADITRQFARQGTAAGPVLSNVLRGSTENLRRGLQRDRASGGGGVGGGGGGRNAALVQRLAALNGRASIETPSITPNTTPSMTPMLAQRAARLGDAMSRGAAGIPQSSYAGNETAKLAALYGGNDNRLASSIFAGGAGVANLVDQLSKLFTSSGGGTSAMPAQEYEDFMTALRGGAP